jgi:ribose transport system substrate-binding protein
MEAGVPSRALAVLLALSLLTCSGGSRKKTIAVIPKSAAGLFWASVQAGALAAAQEYDVEILWNGAPSETDYSRQIQIVDSMIARRVDGIALAAAERKALTQAIDRAAAANIPMTVFDSGVESENFLTFLATNNYEGGEMAARELGKALDGKGEVGIVLHAPGSQSTMDRERGFEDVMAKEFPKIRIVARQFGMSDRAKARAAAENILSSQPNLDGLFASSEPSSLGTALAIKSRGLSGKLKFVAFDSSESMIEDLREGTIHAMVVQDPFRMGFDAVRTIAEHWKGRKPPKRIDLSARVVLKSDLEKTEVRKLLTPDVKK